VRRRQLEDLGYSFDEIEAITDERAQIEIREYKDREHERVLQEQMKQILDGLAPTLTKLAQKNHDVIVEGHTDDVPIRSAKYESNWELSSARATNVVQYLLHKHNFPPKHIAAVGYGENKNLPRETEEDTTSWRQRNRRVVFLVKNPDNPVQKTDGPPAADKPTEH
jgi:chemotaxis protein MotB